jgi:hypothetical protein
MNADVSSRNGQLISSQSNHFAAGDKKAMLGSPLHLQATGRLRKAFRPRRPCATSIFSAPCKGTVFQQGESRPATFAPAGSNRSSCGGYDEAEGSGVEGHVSDLAGMQARNVVSQMTSLMR